MVLCRNMAFLSAPRVGCQIYYVPVKSVDQVQDTLKNIKKNIEKREKKETDGVAGSNEVE